LFESKEETSNEDNEELDEEETVSIEEYNRLLMDLKEVSKFSLYVIKNLPKRKLDDLKDSEHLEKFRTILKERNLIKE